MSIVHETVELSGHIIDSWTLPRTWDLIMDRGGNFEVEAIRVGSHKTEPSYARLKVIAPDDEILERIISELQQLGAVLTNAEDAQTAKVEKNGVLPSNFYSTTNLPTQVRLRGQWVDVANIEMDVVIVVDRGVGTDQGQDKGAVDAGQVQGTGQVQGAGQVKGTDMVSGAGKAKDTVLTVPVRAYCKPMHDVRVGEEIVVGHNGIRVQPYTRNREHEAFAFMQSDVSPERTKVLEIHEIARQMKETRARNGKILFVLGPAVIHTGAGRYIAELLRRGYIQVIFGGNAIITHDIESALYKTSLGVNLQTGEQVEGGHRNHLRAINAIRAAGSIEKAIEIGLLREGIAYEAAKQNIPLVLAGSIRDDGPMPGVVSDMIEAQRRMREEVQNGVEMAIMVSSMLHAIATGNLLPARVRTVVVDINPAVVTKLADRGSFQAAGLVTDAELFLRELVEALSLKQTLP
jgi:lysine-ketoglutarate reductase/saccharopine dehydrogenase-like protein (TIGR00300 family)